MTEILVEVLKLVRTGAVVVVPQPLTHDVEALLGGVLAHWIRQQIGL